MYIYSLKRPCFLRLPLHNYFLLPGPSIRFLRTHFVYHAQKTIITEILTLPIIAHSKISLRSLHSLALQFRRFLIMDRSGGVDGRKISQAVQGPLEVLHLLLV